MKQTVKKACAPIQSFFGEFFGSTQQSTSENRGDIPNAIESVRSMTVLELVHYKSEPVIAITKSPLEWWKMKKSTYPNLARLAKVRLAVQATSVAAERVFSTAGDIVSDRRS